MSKPLTLGYLRKLTKDLPDDTHITECDYDGADLVCRTAQFVMSAQFLQFIPGRVFEELDN